MSDVVSTSTAAFCRGQDHPGCVPVAPVGVSAGCAPEDPLTQPETVLGSRIALRAGHGGVGGRYQHHLPARPLANLDQDAFRGADRRVRGLARHRGLGQELRLEVLDGDQGVVVDDALAPIPGRRGRTAGPPSCAVGRPAVRRDGTRPTGPGRADVGGGPSSAVRCANSAAQRFRWPRCGRSNAGSVVVAVVVTPQSMPIPPSASGAGVTSRVTTNDAYQWPSESW